VVLKTGFTIWKVRDGYGLSKGRGRNFSALRYEPVLKIDPYQRRAWNSAREIERRFKSANLCMT
jgi:hypothetical protein